MQIQKQFDKQLYYSIIPESKRQQTTTVDYKRLINGFVLADDVTLQYKTINLQQWKRQSILKTFRQKRKSQEIEGKSSKENTSV